MTSRISISGAKRMHDSPYSSKYKRSTNRLSMSSTTSRRSVLDPMENQPTSDDLMHDMQVREKQANERTSKAEKERDELLAKMNLLKRSHQATVKTLVDQLEEYKALADGRGTNDEKQYQPDNSKDELIQQLQQQVEEAKTDRQTQIDHLQQQLAHANERRQHYADQIEQRDTERQTELESATRHLEEMRIQQVETLTKRLDQVTEQLQDTQKQVVVKDRRIGELESQRHNHQHEIEEMERKHDMELDQRQMEEEAEYVRLNGIIENLEYDLKTKYQASNKEQREYRKLESEMLELEQKYDDQEEKMKRLDQEHHDSKMNHQVELERLEAMIKTLENDKSQLEHHVSNLEETIADNSTSNDLDRTNKELAIRKNEVQVLQTQVDQYQIDIGAKSAQIDRLTRQLNQMNKDLADQDQTATDTLERIKKQLQMKSKDVNDLRAELEKHMDSNQADHLTLEGLRHELKAKDQIIEHLEKSSSSQLEWANKQLTAKTNQFNELSAQLDAQIDSDQVDQLTRQVDELRHEIKAKDQTIHALEHSSTTQLDWIKKQLAAKTDQVAELQNQIDSSSQSTLQVDRLVQQVKTLRLELETKDEMERTTVATLEHTKNQLAAKNTQLTELEDELQQNRTDRTAVDRLRQQLAVKSAQITELETELQQSRIDRTALDRLRQQLATKTTQLTELEGDLQQNRADRTTVDRLTRQLDELRQQLATRETVDQTQLENIKNQLASKTKQITYLEREQETLQRQLSKAEQDHNKLREELRTTHRQQQQQLADELDSLRAKHTTQLSTLQKETNDLRRTLADRESQLHDRSVLKTASLVEKDQHISNLEHAMSEMGDQLQKMSHTLRQVYAEKTQGEIQISQLQDQIHQIQTDFDGLAADELALRQHVLKEKDLAQKKQNEWSEYTKSLELKVRELEQELEVMQVTAASMEERSKRISELEDMVQVVHTRLAAAIDERDSLRNRFGSVIDDLTSMQSSLG